MNLYIWNERELIDEMLAFVNGAPTKTYFRDRDELRLILSQAICDRTLTDDIKKIVNNDLKAMIYLQFDVGSLTGKFVVEDSADKALFGLMLLFHTGLETALRKCALCGNFFLAEGNRSRLRFCPGVCAGKNYAAKNNERQKRWRERHKQQTNKGERDDNTERDTKET